MVSFRKFALVLTVLACFAGIVSAQVLVTPPSYTTSIIRSEGVTELLPVVSFSVATAPEAPATYTINAYSSVAITSAAGEPQLTVVDSNPANTLITRGTATGLSVTFGNIVINSTTIGVTVSGIRVDASSLPSLASGVTGVGATLFFVAAPASVNPPSLLTNAPVNSTSAYQIPVSAPLSYAVPSFKATTKNSVSGTTPTALSICAVAPFDPAATTAPAATFYVTLTELYNGAFKNAAEEASTDTLTLAGKTYVTNGTKFTVTFTNIPTNVTLYVPTTVTTGGDAPFTLTTGSGDAPVAVPASGVVTYTVTADTTGLDTVDIPVYVAYTGQPALTTKTTIPTVAVAYAPLATTTSIPRFNSTAQTSAVTFTESGCNTSLLFPYVVATGGYDTGLSIANTATDPSSELIGATGACTWYFYGTNAPADPVVGAAIAPGAISAVILSSIAPGFQGYAVAQCGFNFAHGYSFVVNGNTNATASYLPLVLNRSEADLAESLNN